MAICGRQGRKAASASPPSGLIRLLSHVVWKAIVPSSYADLESPILCHVAHLISLPNSLRLDLDFGLSFGAGVW